MTLTRIANVDVKDGVMWIVVVNNDGTTQTVKRPFRYYLLSPERQDASWLELKGNNFFRFIKLFDKQDRDFWNVYRRLAHKFYVHNPIEAARVITGLGLYEGLDVQDLCVLAWDIETNGLLMNQDSLILLISCAVRKNGQLIKKLFSHDEYESQGAMLRAWVRWVQEINPNILCAYNGVGFDWLMVKHVAQLHGVSLNLGRDGSEIEISNWKGHFRKEGKQGIDYHDVKIFGRDYVELMFCVIKSDAAKRELESYSLKYVIKKMGLERENRQHFDASSIQKAYLDLDLWPKIKAYGLDDALDALTLFEKLIPPYFAITKLIPKSLQQIINGATGSQINSCLVGSYLQLSHSIPKASQTESFKGGMTLNTPGLFSRGVFRVDVASLYPSVCIHWNIHAPEKDPFNHFIKFLRGWTEERLRFKKIFEETGDKGAEAMSGALKILANSAYGAMATCGLNFNSNQKAQDITRHGREILTQAIAFAQSHGFEVIYGDTDSLAFTSQNGVTREQGMEFLTKLNAEFPSQIRFSPDGYYDSYFIASSKNYATRSGDKVTIKGASLTSLRLEPALREMLEKIITRILNGEPLSIAVDTVRDYENEIESQTLDPKRWAARRTITEAVLNPTRTTERRVLDAMEGLGLGMGDKIWVLFKPDGSLVALHNWNNDHCKKRLREKLHKAFEVIRKMI